MKKLVLLLLCIVVLFSCTACRGDNSTTTPEGENEIASNMVDTDNETKIIPNDVKAGSEADIAVRETVAAYLDTFISCDFDAIKAAIHPDDMQFFNFESEDQMSFYKTVFPQIKYEFEFVSEYEGVYGVMAQITSPDMAEVYGKIITDYIDSTTGESAVPPQEIITNSTETMLTMLKSPDLKRRVEKLYIYVEFIDGEYIPRCDMYLANELTGGAPEMSDAISSSINETINAFSE